MGGSRDIRQVQNIGTAHRLKVSNHKTRHSTVFTFSDIDYNPEISDELFSERALRRGL